MIKSLLLPLLLCLLLFPAPAGATAPDGPWPGVPPVASYDIEVRLDAEAKTLAAEEIITYTNTSGEPIPDLVFHLYLNAFRSRDSLFLGGTGGQHRGFGWDETEAGWVEVTEIRLVDGPALELVEIEDGTLARADLPAPITPGETVKIALAYQARLPRVFARTGYAGDFFMAGQWFPKLGVWQEGGWNAYPFYPDAEFYADFGNYDVRITLPAGYVTGGTGLPVSTETNPDGSQTVRYRAEGVIDFAWTASPDFTEVSRQVNGVELVYLVLAGHEWSVERALDAAETALVHYSRWYGPYAYPRLTVVDVPGDGQGAGGMEYPTLVTAGTLDAAGLGLDRLGLSRTLEVVVVHEVGHQWWQSMVAFNEAEEPWLDEGFTDYATSRVMATAYDGDSSFFKAGGLELGYLQMRRAEYLTTPATPMYGRAWELDFYATATYAKPVLALTTLERTLGEETMLAIQSAFFQRYSFSHPTTGDFRAVAEAVSGRDLSWFFDGLVYGDGVLNYTVTGLDEHSVTVTRQGELVVPTEVRVTFAGGDSVLEPWSGEEAEVTFTYPDRPPVWSAEVDPERKVVIDLAWADNGLSRGLEVWPWLALNSRLLFQFQNVLLLLGGL